MDRQSSHRIKKNGVFLTHLLTLDPEIWPIDLHNDGESIKLTSYSSSNQHCTVNWNNTQYKCLKENFLAAINHFIKEENEYYYFDEVKTTPNTIPEDTSYFFLHFIHFKMTNFYRNQLRPGPVAHWRLATGIHCEVCQGKSFWWCSHPDHAFRNVPLCMDHGKCHFQAHIHNLRGQPQ